MTDATTETTQAPLTQENVMEFAQAFTDANPQASLRDLLYAMRDAGYQPTRETVKELLA